ncbi:HD domain-containing phosphohydrolase [Desulfoluna sp.]|uniref:HD-GYP domain-containing protein n=1 Tax=Desulfoluna sp. TaxID=2045199 RepID=UPI00262267CF|nr:HD domain-containing phosphohydrolase [Desulfoluna sp.]
MKPTDAFIQLSKYAEDLTKVYKAEKGKRAELRAANLQLSQYARDLTQTLENLKGAHTELKSAYLDTIGRLVAAAEYKDEDTGDHIVRMSRYSELMGKELGLSERDVEHLLYASPMHDIGKIGIPDSILWKNGKLSTEEFEVMKTHTTIGARILAKSEAGVLRAGQQIAITHHERWDGSGYPQGLSGEAIPLFGRIVGLVDVFDALSSRRPYKDPYPVEVALSLIKKGRGTAFDPAIVDLFISKFGGILDIREETGGEDLPTSQEFSWSERDVSDGTAAHSPKTNP